MKENNVVIFCHQAKSGGTSFIKNMHSSFQNWKYYKYNRNSNTYPIDNHIIKYKNQNHFIYGHIAPEDLSGVYPTAYYLTIYRDPSDYIQSLYHFWKREPIKKGKKINVLRSNLITKRLSLPEFIKAYGEYSKLSMNSYHPDKFNWIGITSFYDSSLKLLKKKIPHIIITSHKKERVNPDKPIHESYSNEFLPLVKKHMPIETKLFNLAFETFKKDCLQYSIPLYH